MNVELLFRSDQVGQDGGGRTRLRRFEGRWVYQWKDAGGRRWPTGGLEKEQRRGSWSEAAEEQVRCWPMIGCGPNRTPRGGESSTQPACFLLVPYEAKCRSAGQEVDFKQDFLPTQRVPSPGCLSLFQLRSGDLAASKAVLPGFYF